MFNDYLNTDNTNNINNNFINYAANTSIFGNNNNINNNNNQINSAPGLDYIGYVANQTIIDIAANVTNVHKEQYWSLILIIFPVVTFLGNLLVVLSVIKEKSLRTVTNFFVVSLAVADILVATAVMPFAVYLEVAKQWRLSQTICDAFVATDVMACTASILNLVAIAIDRFIAVTQPIKYARHKNSKRIFFMLAFVWLVSIAIASPIVAGLNNTPQGSRNLLECTFNNPTFVIYSSMFSFYIPAIAMMFLYYKIFKVIRTRAKKTKSKYRIKNTLNSNNSNITNNGANIRTLLKNITTNQNQNTDQNIQDKNNIENNHKNKSDDVELAELLTKNNIKNNNNNNNINLNTNKEDKLIAVEKCKINDKTKKKFPNTNAGSLSPSANASSKEKKVTKTLAIVIGLFLICWFPFFTFNNLLSAICMKLELSCDHPYHADLLTFFTWLGYINSFLNPMLYMLNRDFKQAYGNILRSFLCIKSKRAVKTQV